MSTTVLKSLNAALHAAMADDARVVLLGEDVLDPYGGAFKVARGLSTAFPERVFTTPISEAGFVGVAAGMAMRGLLPVVEIMFGDFLMLAGDQILNHIAKYRWMYHEKVEVPLVIRAPMGGRRGYGPTHSQSIEKHFLGIPGLRTVAPSPFVDPGALLRHAILADAEPVLFVENKLMYARPLRLAEGGRLGPWHVRHSAGGYPTASLSLDGFRQADVTLVAYGGMAELAVEAAWSLMMDEEVAAEVVIPSSIEPLDLEPVLESLGRTRRLVVCEEATLTAGFGAEVLARCLEQGQGLVRSARRVGALDFPIANTRALEDAILPQAEDIVQAALGALQDARSGRPGA